MTTATGTRRKRAEQRRGPALYLRVTSAEMVRIDVARGDLCRAAYVCAHGVPDPERRAPRPRAGTGRLVSTGGVTDPAGPRVGIRLSSEELAQLDSWCGGAAFRAAHLLAYGLNPAR